MAGAVSNFVLARTLLDRGPVALREITEAQSELLFDDEEMYGLSTALGALEG